MSESEVSIERPVSIPIEEVQRKVQAHFTSSTIKCAYAKEMSETTCVFQFLSTNSSCQVLSLACGSAVGAELFSTYFPHASSSLHGIDIELRQTTSFLLDQGYLHSFVQQDLFADHPSEDALHLYRTCRKWIAIHACRTLANRIVLLFKQYAVSDAELLVLPCCLLKQSQYKQMIPLDRWKRIRADKQELARAASADPSLGTFDWREQLAIQIRNEMLAQEFSTAYCGLFVFPEIHSIHNHGLHFKSAALDETFTGSEGK